MPKQNTAIEPDITQDEYIEALEAVEAPTEEKKGRANNNPMMYKFVPETVENPEPVFEALASIHRRIGCDTRTFMGIVSQFPEWQANEGARRMEKEKEALVLKLEQMGLKVTVE